MNLLSSTTVFSLYTLISRILGYFRDILIAIFLGASIFADAFFVAFRIPNTFRRLFAEGTFNAAFIPSYTSEKIKGKKNGEKFANDIFNLLILVLFFIVVLVEIFTPFLVNIIAPGFTKDSEKFNLAVELTRITFPFLFFVSLSSFFSGILNSFNKFAAAAAAPIILNVILILAILMSAFLNLEYVYNLSYGVTIAGFLQLIFLIFFTKNFFKARIHFKYKISSKVKFFFKKLLPSVFSSGVTQVNILVGTIIASFQAGAVSYLYYADRIYQINLAIAGIAVSTVSLPVLSSAIKRNQIIKINEIQNKSIELALLLSIPAAIGIIFSSNEIVSALFGYGSFSSENVRLTSEALKFFGYGVPAFAIVKIMANLFFSRNDTVTPFRISVLVVLLNLIISLIFFREIGFIIIPIATSVSTWLGVLVYYILLRRKNFLQIQLKTVKNLFKIILATILMVALLIFLLDQFSSNLSYNSNLKFVYLLGIVFLVAASYIFLCYLLGILRLKNFKTN